MEKKKELVPCTHSLIPFENTVLWDINSDTMVTLKRVHESMDQKSILFVSQWIGAHGVIDHQRHWSWF